MEGYGGPNINATLSEETLAELRKMSLDDQGIDELITALQRKIMEGQAHIQLREKPTKTQKPTEEKKANQSPYAFTSISDLSHWHHAAVKCSSGKSQRP